MLLTYINFSTFIPQALIQSDANVDFQFASVDNYTQVNVTVPNIWFAPSEGYFTDPTTSPVTQYDLSLEPMGSLTSSLLGFAVFGTTMHGEIYYQNTTGILYTSI